LAWFAGRAAVRPEGGASAKGPNRKDTAMGLFSKDIKTMDDLFMHTLQDIYYAEKQILNALPEMIEKATNRELTAGLKKHLG